MISHGFALCVVLGCASGAAPGPRVEVSLNSPWEHQVVEELGDAPPASGRWQPCAVPGYLRGHDYRRAWFRRSFEVPAAMRGKRIKIRFEGVKYHCRVLVNGKHVGGCFGGYRPFEVDVTDAVKPVGPNELAVGCHDWTGVFTPGRVEFGRTRGGWNDIRGVPRDKVLAPIGGLFALYGIWGDVTLRACPAVHVKDLFIRPSVRRGELAVDYTLANESPADAEVDLRAAVEQPGRRTDFQSVPAAEGSNGRIGKNGRIENPSYGAGADVLQLGPHTVRVPAGKEVTVTLRRAWADPRLWSHVDPYLYHLRTELSTGDLQRTRFGFREFWTEGHRFYLNGKKINLLATSWWPPHAPMAREEIRRRWEAVKQCGCVAFRTHTQPWRSVHYDVADELGLLMIVEGAVWNDDYVYRVGDPVFWNNYAGHLKAMVDRDKNRPSVVMWSLENEFYGGRLNDATPAKADLARMGTLVKQWDPTRPIFYESDGDPGGVADVIGVHYPHEYPQHTCWPNEAGWLAEPQKLGVGMFNGGREEFLWDRAKPLYVGEFLWIPSSDPSWHTVFFGDEAYLDYRRYRNLAKAESWKMQILGYRHFEVGGISPWTVVEGGPLDETNPLYQAHQFAYQPVAAFCHDYDRRFFAGEPVKRRVEVFNDLPERSGLTLRWTLATGPEGLPLPMGEGRGEAGAAQARKSPHPNPLPEGEGTFRLKPFPKGEGTSRLRAAAQGQQSLELGPADHRMLEVVLPMPEVSRRTPAAWHVTLLRNGQTVFEQMHELSVFPRRQRLAVDAKRIGLFDPKGVTRKALQRLGMAPADVPSLAGVPDSVDVLVIGAGTLAAGKQPVPVIGRVAPERAGLDALLARGGRVLVLAQEAYPPGLFEVALSGHRSTMTFAARPGHPALAGVEPEDLKFWRGDHRVTGAETVRPAGGGVPIVVSGSAAGLSHAPLMECRAGRGSIVFAQLKLIEKLGSEPTAGQILENLLGYLADYRPVPRKTALVGGPPEYRACLRSLGLRFDDLTGAGAGADLSGYRLVIWRGGAGDPGRLARFVEQGGNLLVHRPAPEDLVPLGAALGIDLVAQAYTGPVDRVEGDHPMIEAILREDLYWLGPHVGISWAETPRATDMADGIFSKKLPPRGAKSYEVEDWALEGGIVERRKPGVVFATVGTATAEIDFPATGPYVVGIVARGTPCDGVYPLVRVAVDGHTLGTISVPGDQWRTVTTFGRVAQGRHKLSVAFTNDGSNPPAEDRNLFVDKVLIAPDRGASGVAFLTHPPAVAVAARGKGTVVIDRLRWDTEEPSARKAARYAGSLLGALGGDFTPRARTVIACASMTPQPGMPHFHNYGSHVALACSGWIKTPIQVAAAGRYTVELVASGTPAQEVYPLVEVRLDGRKLGQVQLASGNWRPYWLGVALPEGKHELVLAFVNDFNRDGEDRNLLLERAVFYRE